MWLITHSSVESKRKAFINGLCRITRINAAKVENLEDESLKII